MCAKAEQFIGLALALDPKLIKYEQEIDKMLPNIDDDGRWEASYALNTGAMMLSLIELMRSENKASYKDAVTLFFDTVDFKVQQSLEASGIKKATEEQIAGHDLMIREREWFASITAA